MTASPSSGERAESVSDGSSFRRLRFRLVRRLLLVLVLLGLAVGAGIWVHPHARAWYHRRAARNELQHYHNRQAIQHLLICREIWPRDPEVLLLAARASRRAQVYGDAERLLRIYQEVRGRDDAHAFEQLLLATECRVDEFSESCWKCIEEGRLDPPLLMEALTKGYFRQYRLGQARLCLNRWKEEQPNNPQVYFLEGLLLLDYLHVAPDAIASYRRAVELDADHEEARLGLAVALLTDKHYEEAAEQFERLLRDQPDNVRVQAGLAECRESLGETEEAERLVEDVLTQQPQMSAALSLRGQLALRRGQWKDAAIYFRQALRGNPLDHRARYSLVLCLEHTGQEEEAREQRRQLHQQEEDVARFHDIVTKEIAERPTDPALHCQIGQMLLRSGQRDEGIRWLQSALQLDPNYAAARQALADSQRQTKSEGVPADLRR